VTSHAGQEVPVVDPLTLLGLAPMDAADLRAGVVLDFGHGQVVLAVTELLELRTVAPDDVLPVPRHAADRPDLTAGVLDLAGEAAGLVLDGPALLLDPELSALAGVTTALAGAGVPDDARGLLAAAAARGGPVYLTYGAGVDVATPLEQVTEILPFPTRLTGTAGDGSTLGVVVHRRSAVPVVWLPGLLGRGDAEVPGTACLLLVEVDGEHIAFGVPVLREILPLTWSDPDRARGQAIPDLARALHSSPLVQVGVDARLVPDLDLREVARALRGAVLAPDLVH
jgi:purine-binding chemotaxis protein CheW